MRTTSPAFKENARRALGDAQLQKTLGFVRGGFVNKRLDSVDALPEFEALREQARDIKNHTLAHLDLYLEAFEEKVTESGGVVHYAETAAEARDIILDHLPQGRRQDGHQGQVDDRRGDRHQRRISRPTASTPVETDLGEYIIQLRHEPPSHIIAPAVHLTKEQVEADFRRVHTDLPRRPRPLRTDGAARRGARRAAPALPCRRGRHHRRQFPRRRDRHLGDRHQ